MFGRNAQGPAGGRLPPAGASGSAAGEGRAAGLRVRPGSVRRAPGGAEFCRPEPGAAAGAAAAEEEPAAGPDFTNQRLRRGLRVDQNHAGRFQGETAGHRRPAARHPGQEEPAGPADGFMGAVDPNERRIVLVGKTGVGKSAAGNTILGGKVFKSKRSPSSLTTDCHKAKGSVDGRPVAVIDTPGLFDTKLTQEEAVSRIKRCISLSSPGPHAFLVVLQPGRFTQEEKETVQMIQNTFGEDAAKYTMVLFTHRDQLEEDETIEGFISESPDLVALIQSCSNRYHVFNNKVKDLKQTSQLLEKIDKMTTANGGSYYSNDMFKKAEAAIEKEKERLLKKMEVEKQKELEELRVKYSGKVPHQAENKVNQKFEEKARTRAERFNKFTKLTAIAANVISGATMGSTLGTSGGPIGMVVGGATGAVIGATVGVLTMKISEHCTTQ